MLGLTYGLYDNLEVGLALQRANRDRLGSLPVRGFEDLNAKYKFIAESSAAPASAATLDLKLPSASRANGLSTGRADQALLLIASKSFTPVALHANLGYRIVGDRPGARLGNVPHGGAALGRSLRPTGTAVQTTFGLTWTLDLAKARRP